MATKTAAPVISLELLGHKINFGTSNVLGTLHKIHDTTGHLEGLYIAQFGQTFREICEACDGSGYRPGYGYVDSGRCWPCGYSGLGRKVGSGTLEELTKLITRRVKDRARRAAKRMEKANAETAIREADHINWKAANPELVELSATYVALGFCGHNTTGNDCWRGDCQEARDAIRETHDDALFAIAWTATWRALSPAETDRFRALVATQVKRDAARVAKAEATAARQWVATAEGQKITVTGTLGKAFHFEGNYGTSTLYRLTTAEGNTVTWFRSGFHEVEEGATVTLTGTVKELKETDKYGKETQLTRCKIS